MKKYLQFKYKINQSRQYIFIFLTATIFLFANFTSSLSEEGSFVVNNISIKSEVNLNFSREKYIDKAFNKSFKVLMNNILLSQDIKKIDKINLTQIKSLVSRIQVIQEIYSKNTYEIILKITYDENKVKKILRDKNIPFSQPENISVVFFPALFINNEVQNLNENYFYNNWQKVKIKNEIINFILPLEDLDDISQITKVNDNIIEEFDIDTFINKYDVESYVFALMNYENKNLSIHLKANFNKKKISKNIKYKLENINSKSDLDFILRDLKLNITDLWKQENLINLLMPLSVNLKFQHKNSKNLDGLLKIINKINIINNYTLVKFDINNSFFKIYYYGNPKKLKLELSKYGYQLNNNQGSWELYLNE